MGLSTAQTGTDIGTPHISWAENGRILCVKDQGGMQGRARPVGNRLGISGGGAYPPGVKSPSIDRVNRARYTSGTLFNNLNWILTLTHGNAYVGIVRAMR